MRFALLCGAAGAALALTPHPSHAAEAEDPRAGHVMPAPAAADPHADHITLGADAAPPHDHTQMRGTLGLYPMTRDASGTSWHPDSTPMQGLHGIYRGWSMMTHGDALLIYTHQGGERGGNKIFSESMFMVGGQHPLGAGAVTLRGMVSLDPLMGARGYPLLLQTGETADGRDLLIDRQHPHDFLMELSGTFSHPLGNAGSLFLYAGYPGEPALGPPAFMHRVSGLDNPEAPISHHWLDSTHVTFGVLTAGVVASGFKLEGSLFNGREPDENRWDFEQPRFDSVSARLSWNPAPNWSFQASYGSLQSPEILEPGVDQRRITASAIYNRPMMGGNWQTTVAWGQNRLDPGPVLDAFLLETAFTRAEHTLFGRAERTEKNELFDHHHALHGLVFDVGKLSAGYLYDLPILEHIYLSFGAVGSLSILPDELEPFYSARPTSVTVFTRFKLK